MGIKDYADLIQRLRAQAEISREHGKLYTEAADAIEEIFDTHCIDPEISTDWIENMPIEKLTAYYSETLIPLHKNIFAQEYKIRAYLKKNGVNVE